MKNLKNFKSINPEDVKGTILSGCNLPGDSWCGCNPLGDDVGHHCNECPDCVDPTPCGEGLA